MLEILGLVVGGALAVVAAMLVRAVLHESAHAVVARLVGCGLQSIHIGGGPAIYARWIGRVLFVLGKSLDGGLVHALEHARAHQYGHGARG